MSTEQTKTNETKTNQVKANGVRPAQTVSPKDNPLFFEVPLPESEGLDWLTDGLKTKRKMAVAAVTVRISDGRLMVGVLPETAVKDGG